MDHKLTEYKQITQFLQTFTILSRADGATVIASENNTYLVRDIELADLSGKGSSEQLNQIVNTLCQHQTLSSKNILSLIDFEIIFNKTKTQTQIRAVYEYGQKSLAKEIQERKLSEEQFDEEALWGMLYSITSPLAYLQEKNIIYGVIDASRIFLDNNAIAIIDPSSTGIDPYEILPGRLFSPQLLHEQRSIEEIDMFKSDVFVLGLLMLQCALLKLELCDYDQNILQICMSEIKDVYSQSFYQLITSMLHPQPQIRPSFTQVLKSISDLFQISTSQIQTLLPACLDKENQCNQMCGLGEYVEKQNIDILETQYIRYQQPHNNFMTELQKTKHRFANSRNSQLTQSPIYQASQYSQTSSLFIEDSIVKSFQKSKRIYKPKEIKDKLVKHQIFYHSQQDHLQNHLNLHPRTKTYWENPMPHNNQLKYPTKNNQTQTKRKQTSKENHSSYNNFSSPATYSPLNKENLFTKPQIMNMIKNDIKKIQQKKKNGISIHFNYSNTNQGNPRSINKAVNHHIESEISSKSKQIYNKKTKGNKQQTIINKEN